MPDPDARTRAADIKRPLVTCSVTPAPELGRSGSVLQCGGDRDVPGARSPNSLRRNGKMQIRPALEPPPGNFWCEYCDMTCRAAAANDAPVDTGSDPWIRSRCAVLRRGPRLRACRFLHFRCCSPILSTGSSVLPSAAGHVGCRVASHIARMPHLRLRQSARPALRIVYRPGLRMPGQVGFRLKYRRLHVMARLGISA